MIEKFEASSKVRALSIRTFRNGQDIMAVQSLITEEHLQTEGVTGTD